jgi:DNA-binding transcriptional regulator WhiA
MRSSFTLSVKQEIIETDRNHNDSVLFLIALIRINGTLDGGKIKVRINDEELRNKIAQLINKTFNTRVQIKNNLI